MDKYLRLLLMAAFLFPLNEAKASLENKNFWFSYPEENINLTSVFFKSGKNNNVDEEQSKWRIDAGYFAANNMPFGTCSPLGVSNPSYESSNDEEVIIWGRVDLFDSLPSSEAPPYSAICSPLKHKLVEYGEYNSVLEAQDTAYILCSEKQEKSVIICLRMNYDEPKLAQEVFSTFRWLDGTEIFPDVPTTHPNAQAIQYVKEQGIVEGYTDPSDPSGQVALYKPENPINRAEFTKILVGASAYASSVSGSNCFPDVQEEWFAKYVCTAKEHSIIAGHPDGTFHPADNINTAEAAKILVNTFGIPLPLQPVQIGNEEPWYIGYMTALGSAGALPDSAKDPSHLLTRGEMAEMIWRVKSR